VSQKILSLKQNSAELRSALTDGTLWAEDQLWKVFPREVAFYPLGVESVIFEATPIDQWQRPPLWKWVAQAIRPKDLSLSLAPALAVWVSGVWDHRWASSITVTILVFLLILCLQVAVHLLNDVEDHLRLVDRPGMVGGSGVIQKGWVSAKNLKAWGWAFWILAIVFGFSLLGQHLLVSANILGIFGILGVVGFATGPFAFRYRSFGDLLVFFLAGPFLTLGVAQVLFHQYSFREFLLGVFFGWIAWATFHSKHLQTFEADRQWRVLNLAIWMGYSVAKSFLGILYGLAYFTLGWGVFLGEIPLRVFLLVLLALPLIISQVLLVYRASGPASVLMGQVRPRGNQIQIVIGILTLIGFFLKF